jgi:membrane peptidoglycan carboxypeptidase
MALGTLMLFGVALGSMALAAASLAVYRGYANDLKPPEDVISENSIGQSIAYDRNGQKLYEYVDPYGRLRDPVPLTEISPYMVAATVATEERKELHRAGGAAGELTPFGPNKSSGSSITQQLAGNVYIPLNAGPCPTDSGRKAKETVIALN